MNAANSRNMNTKVAETPSGMPNTPSVVNQRWFTSCEIVMFWWANDPGQPLAEQRVEHEQRPR